MLRILGDARDGGVFGTGGLGTGCAGLYDAACVPGVAIERLLPGGLLARNTQADLAGVHIDVDSHVDAHLLFQGFAG